jgi:hypothetical protein
VCGRGGIYKHTCIYSVYKHMFLYTYLNIHRYMQICIYRYIYIQFQPHVCYINIPSSTLIAFFGLTPRSGVVRGARKGGIKSIRNICIYMYILIYIDISKYTSTYIYFLSICMYICACILEIYVYPYIYTYI